MRVVTWNVNSIRVREERLLAFLLRHRPDVVCLQEIKVVEEAFPFERIEEAGYHAVVNGQKTYNGVAVLARAPIELVGKDLCDGGDDSQKRLIDVRVEGVRVVSVYVPNGGEVGSEKWAFKLDWLDRLRRRLEEKGDPEEPMVVCGDFNVAPDDRDVENPSDWADTVLCHPEARQALSHVVSWGLEDAFRLHEQEKGFYSWWDYRRLGFPKNDGLRIDHVYLTAPLARASEKCFIDRDERKGKQPSDHAPVLVDFAPPR